MDKDGKFWFATSLSKPVKFNNIEYANQALEFAQSLFPEDIITIKEEIIPGPTTNTVIAKKGIGVEGQDWNWNNDDPF